MTIKMTHVSRLGMLLCLWMVTLCGLQAVEQQVAHGYLHTLYLASDGTVWATGRNNYGQLGDGTQSNKTTPVKVDLSGVSGQVVEISAGAYHSVLRTSNGSVYCWGRNDQGQCGQSSTTNMYLVPTDANVGNWAKSIDAGYKHTLVALHQGSMYNFGDNAYGQIGNNKPDIDTTIRVLVSIANEEIIDVSAGRLHSMALCASGNIYTWGGNGSYQLGHGDTTERHVPVLMTGLSDVIQISAGGRHSMALTEGGVAYGWGENSFAQCDTTVSSYQTTPNNMYSAVTEVCAGYATSYVLYATGQVYAQGYNTYGSCGNGTTDTPVVSFVAVAGMTLVKSLAQDANYYSMSAIRADGSMHAWGYNSYSMLNVGTTGTVLDATTVVAQWPVDEIVDVEAGYNHNRGKKADGTLWMWGSNVKGQMGIGSLGGSALKPVQGYNGINVTDIHTLGVGFGSHNVAVRSSGYLYTWGDNTYGQVGNGSSGSNESLPESQGRPYYLRGLASGYDHSLAIRYDGNVYTTGRNHQGQLGDGNRSMDVQSFTSIAIYNAKKVAGGQYHSAAVRADGTVACWGWGLYGQLGTGATTTFDVPQQVLKAAGTPLTNIVDVATGYAFTVALDANGNIWTWGANFYGQTGHGTNSGNTLYATKVGSGYYAQISAGRQHVAAVDRYGDVWTWGNPSYGRLGNGASSGDVFTPVNVSNSTAIDGLAYDVSCGAEGTVVLLPNGHIYSVGHGNYGQMGNNGSLSTNVEWTAIQKTYYPEITISASSDAYESGADANFTLTRSLSVSGVLETTGITRVHVNPNQGVAIEGVDINSLSQPITILAGATSAVFTVDAIDDAIDEDSESISIIITPDVLYQTGSPSSASRIIVDNDTASISVTAPASAFTDEFGASVSFILKLNTQPTADVTINYSISDASEGSLSNVSSVTTGSLTIPAASWTSFYYAHVYGRNDDIDDGNVSYTFNVTSVTSSDGKYNSITPNSFNSSLTNTDNDTAGYTFTSVGNTTEAGGTTVFSMVLDTEPTANVVVTFDSSNTDEGTVSPSSLTFTSANWNDAGSTHQITVTGVDDNIDDGSIVYQVNGNSDTTTTDANYKNMVVGNASLKNFDDDTAGISVTSISNNTSEDGTTATFSITLDSEPLNDVQIAVSSGNAAEGQPSVTSVTFTPAQWNTAKVITVNPVDDSIVDGTVSYDIITGSAASGDPKYDGINPTDVTVSNEDDDGVGVTLAGHTTLNVSEAGTTDSYTMVLRSEPVGGNVLIDVTSDAQVTVDPAQVTFTTSNWDTVQTITVTAVDDAIDEAATHNATITNTIHLPGTGSDYDGLAATNFTATVTDDDTAGVTFAGNSSVDVTEGGSSDTYTIVLDSEPLADITITPTASGVTVSPTSYTFTSDDWNQPQSVSVVAIDDDFIEGAHTGSVSHAASNAGGDTHYVAGLSIGSVTPNITDNDTAAILVSSLSGTTTESSGTHTFVVTLATNVAAGKTVSIGISSNDIGEGTVDLSTAVLNGTNWNTGVTVTVSGQNDDVDDGDVAYSIVTTIPLTGGTADSDYAGINPSNISLINTDNDTAGVTVVGTGNATEGGATGSYTLALNTQPTSTVTIDVSAISEVAVSPTTLIFTTANYATVQTVTVTAIDDYEIDPSADGLIAHSATGGGYDAVAIASVAPNITDNDTATITVTPTSGLTTSEAGGTATFTVVLDSIPSVDVSFGFEREAEGLDELSPLSSITFTPGNWNVEQTVTVTGVDDNIIDGDITSLVSVAVSGAAGNYAGVASVNVSVTNTDDDTAGVVITETDSSTDVAEVNGGGGTDTYTITLTAEPSANVTVTLGHIAAEILNDVSGSVTFTTDGWEDVKTITITAGDDGATEGNQDYTITHTVTSGDTDFNGISAANVIVHVADDDSPGLLITETDGSTVVREDVPVGAGLAYTDTIMVRLLTLPSGEVTVTLAANADVVYSTDTLTFTTSGPGIWSTPQTVTITGASDADAAEGDPESVTVGISCANGGYGAVTGSLDISVIDSDVPGLTIGESGGSTDVAEATTGTTDSYTVVLDSPPGASIFVGVQTSNQVTLSQTLLSFSDVNWFIPQEVVVTAVDDAIDESTVHTVSIANTPNNGYNGNAGATVTLNVTDNDTAGMLFFSDVSGTVPLNNNALSVTEDDGSLTPVYVKISSQPELGTSVTFTATSSQITITSPLVFNDSNWNSIKIANFSGITDDIDEGGTTTIHNGSFLYAETGGASASYNSYTSATVLVNVHDNDDFGFTVSAISGDTKEVGLSQTFTVKLNSDPTATVSIPVSSLDLSEGTVSPSTLIFNPGSATTAQTVTVTGVDDSIADGDIPYTIQLGAASSADAKYNGQIPSNVSVENDDNDIAGLTIVETTGATSVAESGTTIDTFTVQLNTQPVGNVVVTIAHTGSGVDVEIKEGVTAYASIQTLTFTNTNWNTAQIVTVRAVDDAFDEGTSENAPINVATSANDYVVSSTTIAVSVSDNDTAGFVLTPVSGLSLTEAGGTDTFTIALNSKPTDDVKIKITSPNTSEATVSPAAITFTGNNYNTPVMVTLTGVNDAIDDGDATFNIAVLIDSTTDVQYASVSGNVGVTTIDDDTVSITLNPDDNLTTTEAGSVTIFNVSIGSEPTGDIVLDFASDDVSEGVISASQLTYTSANWFIPQTIIVTGVDDNIADGTQAYNINMTVNTATVDGQYKVLPADSVRVYNTDNDSPGVTITQSSSSTAVVEGGASDSFDVVLTAAPLSNVTITVNPEPELTADTATLTFTSGNWNSLQTVTVSAAADVVMEATAPHAAKVFLTSSGDSTYAALPFQFVEVSITDNDTAAVTVSPTSGLTTQEDSSAATYTIVLATEPTSNVTISLISSDTSEGYPDPSSVTFTASNWNTAQTITVYGVDDNVKDGDSAYTVSSTANSADVRYDGISVSSVALTNTDNDSAGITMSTSTLTVNESGTSDSFTVVLTSEPTSPVSIAITSSDETEVISNISTLSFTSATWDIEQSVTISGVDDIVQDGSSTSTITLAASVSSDGNYSGITPTAVTVTNTDDDTASVQIVQSSGFTQVTEGAVTDTYTVILGTQPTEDITITVTTDSQVSVDATSLVFTTSNWNAAQTLTVSALDDDIEEGAQLSTITMASTTAEYNTVSISSVSVTITDNDTAGITVSPIAGLITTEIGGTASATIVLDSEPTANVTFAIASTNTAEGTVSPASVTFTSANWSTEQTITVTGVDDAAADDGDQNYSITIAADNSTLDTLYNAQDPDDIAVSNTDDDGAAVTITPTLLSISEAGTTATYTVVLASLPSADVAIALTVESTQVTLSTSTLTFTSADWNTPQTVTVGAVNDDIAEGTHNISITHVSSGGGYDGISVNSVTVAITDNDSAGVTVSPISGLQTAESGTTDTCTVVLTSQPTSNVTINVSSSDTSEGTVSPGSLTFTAANWSTVQTVTVIGADDNSADGNVAYSIVLSAVSSDDSFYDGGTPIDPTDVSVSNTDDEVAGITVTPISGLTTTESGGSSVFTVRLNTQPTADVAIAVASNNSSEGTTSVSSLTFTSSNWSTSQTVTVMGVNDDVEDDDQPYTVILGAAVSTDASYGGQAGIDPNDVAVTNLDDDTAGFTITPTSGLVTSETGNTATFTVVLDAQPTASVAFDMSSSDFSEGVTDTSTLIFTIGDWNTPQTVTLTGQDDAITDGDIAYTIITNNVVTSDAKYAVVSPDDISVSNQDNDSPAINITQSSGSTDVSESGLTSDTYTIVLSTQPSAQVDVTVNVSSGQITASPTTVTFTAGDYNVAQTVTVTAVQDAIAEGVHTDLIAHVASSADANYNAIAISNVESNITDNDTASILVSPISGLITTELGGTAQFTIVLATQPTASVVIPITSDNTFEGTASVSSVLFTTGNWETAQTVTVTGVDDVADDGPVAYTINVSIPTTSDAQYAALNPSDVSVTNSDNDGADVIFAASLGSVDVSEDGVADSYTAVLNKAPTADVVVTAISDSDLTVVPSSHTFTSDNWAMPQSFAVTAVDDDIAEGTHLGSIAHTAASADVNYSALPLAAVSAIVIDNDTASVLVNPLSGLSTNETGSTDSFTVRLNSKPTADVSFTITSLDVSEGVVSISSLTFTATDWQTEQTVTITGVDDGDADGTEHYTVQTGVVTSMDTLYNGLTVANVVATNQDDDQAGILVSVLDNSTEEADVLNTARYALRLATAPTANVMLAVTVDVDGVLETPSSLTFTPTDWNQAQTITLHAFDDALDENAHSAVVSFSLSGDATYAGLTTDSLAVNVLDNDSVGITLSKLTGLVTTEIGGTDTYTIVLDSQPTAAVALALTSSDTTQATVPLGLVTFTDTNWNVPQTITLSGVDTNNTDDGNVPLVITHIVSSADAQYNALPVSNVAVVNQAVNNEPTLTDPNDVSMNEDAPEQTVLLTGISDGQTGENQTLTITAVISTGNTGFMSSPVVLDNGDGTAQLTFTPVANQSGVETITVTVLDSGATGGNHENTITQDFTVTVLEQNDLPVIFVQSIVHNLETVALLAQTGADNAISNTEMHANDIETADAVLLYTLVLRPSQGSLQLNGINITQGGQWTQADIDAGNITYRHDGLPGGSTDGFAFKVEDLHAPTAGESSGVFQIYVDRSIPSVSLTATTLDYPENAGAIEIDSSAVVTVGDNPVFNNGYVLIEWTAGQTANDNFVFTGVASVDAVRVVTVNGVNIGNVDSLLDGQNGSDLRINLVATTPTAANVQALVTAIAYQNDSDNPSAVLRTFQITLHDGFLTSGTSTRDINMQASNDAPVVGVGTSYGTVIDVNLIANVPVSDVDGTIASMTITNSPSLGTVAITNAATGAFFYQPTSAASGTDTFDILVTDDLGATATATITVSITNVNISHPRIISDPPMFALDGDTLVYTPVLDPLYTVTGIMSYELLDKPSGFPDPISTSSGTISWDLTGHGGETLRFSYLVKDVAGATTIVGIQPVMIQIYTVQTSGN